MRVADRISNQPIRKSKVKKTPTIFIPLLAALLLAACNQQQPQDTNKPTAATPSTAPLKIAFVYNGPVGDGGWTYAHDQARKTIQAEFADRIDTTYVENVPDGPTSEKTFKDLALQGNRVIFGTSYGYMDAMLAVAKQFPDIKFENATGDRTAANLAVYAARTYESAYLAGILAGKVSKSGKLGFVASIPIPEVFRNINAFTLGAQSINPQATTDVAWVDSWFDPARERDAALDLIGKGADVLMQNTDSPAVLQAAQQKGAMAFGWDSDMTQYGPAAHLGSAVIDWSPYYKKVVLDVLEGKWKPGSVWWGARQNVVRIASPKPELAPDVLLLLGEKTHALKSGALHPFGGTLTDIDGKLVAADGATLDDAQLQRMRFLVKGVRSENPK